MAQGSSNNPNRTYNLISTLFLVLTALTVFVVIVVGFVLPKPPSQTAGEPTLLVFPSDTPTLPGPTANATWTASPFPTVTNTQPATRTPNPSETATPTDTATATATMTKTQTPLPTKTFTPTRTPTRGPFDYVIQDGKVVFSKNNKFSGCDAVIAGVVKDRNGNQSTQTGMIIQVTGDKPHKDVIAGDHTEYGTSGWEFYYNNTAEERSYDLQLLYPDGTIASDVWSVDTSDQCNRNLAFVTWLQVQPRATSTP